MSDPAAKRAASASPLWRQAFDAAERAVTPRADQLVRTEYFSLGVALARRARTLADRSVQRLSARAWHAVNLPAGSDISRLRAQIGALDREVRRLTIPLESERRRAVTALPAPTTETTSTMTEDSDAVGAQSPDGPRPRPARRRTQRPASP